MPETRTVTGERAVRTCDACGVSETIDITGDVLRTGAESPGWTHKWRRFVIGAADDEDPRLVVVHQRDCAVRAFTVVVNRLYPTTTTRTGT